MLILYFRYDLKGLRHVPADTASNGIKNMFREDEEHALLFSAAHKLIQELNETFETAAANKYQKEGLLMALQPKLSKYKKLKGTALQVSVNNHIIRKSEQISIQVEENDLNNMW